MFINDEVNFIFKKDHRMIFLWSCKNYTYLTPITINVSSNLIFRKIMERFQKVFLTATR